MRPLAGITVVSLEVAVAAPLASRHLADWGARVIKVERPGGGDFARRYDQRAHGLSSHFVWVNRSKESITLDLKSAPGREIMEQLLGRADVFLHNLAPGAVDRLGFSAARLRQAYPRLIICGISGYGLGGPYQDKKAYDLLIQAEAGVLAVTGTEEAPAKVGIPVADIAAGLYAYSGILTALLARHQTGEGTVLEISMLEALAEWMGYPAYYTLGGDPPPRSGAGHAAIAPYGPFATGDGQLVLLSIQNEREWTRFCNQVLEQPTFTTDPRFHNNSRRVANRPELEAEITAVFARLSREEIIGRLEQAKIANAAINSVHEFLAHPQLAARQRWQEVDSPVGRLPALLPPVNMVGVEPVMAPVPQAGEHTQQILNELAE
jgi:crotonobetainyl-CoA:carnitine CoA-transferase CaiB-like acyl-CoA transferase